MLRRPPLHPSSAAVTKMIQQAAKRGYVTYEQLNAVMPSQDSLDGYAHTYTHGRHGRGWSERRSRIPKRRAAPSPQPVQIAHSVLMVDNLP